MSISKFQRQMTPLLMKHNKKPIDAGIGGLTASINTNGFIHSINSFHSEQGYITVSSANQFPNDKWFDSSYVRQYRREHAENKQGFGVVPDIPFENVNSYHIENTFPCFQYEWQGVSFESTFFPVEHDNSCYFIHDLKITNHDASENRIPFKIGGIFSLNRCSYGQLTEGGPILLPDLENKLFINGHHLTISNEKLPATFSAFHFSNGHPLLLTEENKEFSAPIHYHTNYEVEIKKGQTDVITSVYTFSNREVSFEFAKTMLQKAFKRNDALKIKEDLPYSFYIIERNVDYIISCCSVPVTEDHICIITDHQLLPLSWNRDAFYMINLLLEVSEIIGQEKKEKIQQIVSGHLCWVFEKAQRTETYWGRAYLTNGFCKDKIFQLDQQLYPLLELCRYFEIFKDNTIVHRLQPYIEEILQMILLHRDEEKWLFKTGETPADDKVDYPYHFSSQILLWYTLKQLETLNKLFAFTQFDLHEMARNVKRDCLNAFTAEINNKKVFAYLTDLKGNYKFYHDANDLPTALAPLLNFCSVEEETWIQTMEFAFTTENKGGYYSGQFKGLGSIHTPHPWPLGDGQELLYCYLTNQNERLNIVWEKIIRIVQWDGLFSEAVNNHTGDVESRHWFSWPGAFISAVLVQMNKHH
jgi:uncharacterized protein